MKHFLFMPAQVAYDLSPQMSIFTTAMASHGLEVVLWPLRTTYMGLTMQWEIAWVYDVVVQV